MYKLWTTHMLQSYELLHLKGLLLTLSAYMCKMSRSWRILCTTSLKSEPVSILSLQTVSTSIILGFIYCNLAAQVCETRCFPYKCPNYTVSMVLLDKGPNIFARDNLIIRVLLVYHTGNCDNFKMPYLLSMLCTFNICKARTMGIFEGPQQSFLYGTC